MIFQAEFWCIFVCVAHVTIPNYSGPTLTGPMGRTIA